MGDRVNTARKKVSDEPYDVESWQIIAKDLQGRPADDDVRDTYEEIVTLFPSSGRFWKMYIDHEIRFRNFDRVEKLFKCCLIKVLNIDLWKTYLNYVKETKHSLPTYKETMAQAYELALDKMGMDVASASIWNDYLRLLKGVEATGSYAENQKITAIRKVYQKGITTPIIGIENLWKDYVSFEQGINPIIAEKMTMDRSRDYMKARRVAKEYEACIRGLNKAAVGVPPTGSVEEKKQVELWSKYCAWERSNPLQSEDQNLIIKRVMFAYEQCLLVLGHHANIWLEAAQFLEESSRILAAKGDVDASKAMLDQTETFYERATAGVLSKSMLMHFAYADFQEQQNKFEKVNQIYTKFLENAGVDPSLCYIQYMKFCRRSEGTAAARAVFKKAREDGRCRHHVFVAAALMEYYCTKDKKIAGNVFELGFKKYKNDRGYVLDYIEFLSHLNEDNNTRVLFERTLSSGSLSAADSVDVWNKFLEFESAVGDLPGIVKVEKRRSQAFDQANIMAGCETARLIDRYRFKDLYPASVKEMRCMGYETNDEATKKQLYPVSALSAAPLLAADGDRNGAKAALEEEKPLPKPDTSQMVPFKPKFKWFAGEHRLPGGGFPIPQAAAELCQSLPPPACFQGPFVVVDRLMESFMSMQLPKELIVPRHINNGHSIRLFDTAKANEFASELSTSRGGSRERSATPSDSRKRRKSRDKKSDDEDDAGSSAPVNDIYRQRQQKRMK